MGGDDEGIQLRLFVKPSHFEGKLNNTLSDSVKHNDRELLSSLIPCLADGRGWWKGWAIYVV